MCVRQNFPATGKDRFYWMAALLGAAVVDVVTHAVTVDIVQQTSSRR